MSIIPSFFSRRRHEPPYHQPYSYQNHGMGNNNFGSNYSHYMSLFPSTVLPPSSSSSSIMNSRIEMKETPEAHVYKAHLPGMKSSDVRVEVDDDRVLCIICEKKSEKEEQRGGWHRMELCSGHFLQRLTLPHNSKPDHVKAYMDNGVLTVTVPKHTVKNVNRPYPVRNINISHA